MKKSRTKKKKTPGVVRWLRKHPVTMAAVCLTVFTLALAVQLPKRMAALDHQQEEIHQLMQTYNEKQAEAALVSSEAALIDTPEFIEKLARRESSYGWYGETVYKIGNLQAVWEAEGEPEE